MARPAPPSDDGSPARVIATLVGIVGILLLGSLAWSAIAALAGAIGAAGSALSAAHPSTATLAPVVTVTATDAATPVVATTTPEAGVVVVATLTPEPSVAATSEVAATPTAAVAGRNPWILLPRPEPGTSVPPGPVVVEARGRGDAPIAAIGLDLDGTPLPVALEQRSESTWRGFASARVAPGQHTVRATVTDADGRTGSFRWTFNSR